MSSPSRPELPVQLVEHRFDGYWGPLWAGRDGEERVLVRLVDSADLTDAERKELAAAVSAAAAPSADQLVSMRAWTEAEPQCALVSDYVDGVPLDAILRAAQQGEIDLTVSLALGIARDVVDAVEKLAAEEVGGLTPQTFIVCADGQTRMLEPGLAPLLRRCKAFAQRPERLGYDAPEAFQLGVELTRSTDVFSLGVMLWELMTHERLFKGTNTFKIITQLRTGNMERADEHARSEGDPVPAEVADVIQRATEREADESLRVGVGAGSRAGEREPQRRGSRRGGRAGEHAVADGARTRAKRRRAHRPHCGQDRASPHGFGASTGSGETRQQARSASSRRAGRHGADGAHARSSHAHAVVVRGGARCGRRRVPAGDARSGE